MLATRCVRCTWLYREFSDAARTVETWQVTFSLESWAVGASDAEAIAAAQAFQRSRLQNMTAQGQDSKGAPPCDTTHQSSTVTATR